MLCAGDSFTQTVRCKQNTRGLLSPVALDATAIAQNGNGFTQEQHSGSENEAMQRLVADVDALLDAVAEHIRELRYELRFQLLYETAHPRKIAVFYCL